MTTFACFGPIISTEFLIIILGITLGIEAILAGGIAFIISKVFRIPKRKVLGAGAILLFVCGMSIIPFGFYVGPFGFYVGAPLSLSGAVTCGCLLALGGIIRLIRGGRLASA